MKKIFLIISLLGLLSFTQAQEEAQKPKQDQTQALSYIELTEIPTETSRYFQEIDEISATLFSLQNFKNTTPF